MSDSIDDSLRVKTAMCFGGLISVAEGAMPKPRPVTAGHVAQARSGAGASLDDNSKEGNG